MSLPTPSLDDRRFQDIVDEAKRLIPQYCPEWTDHNLSDPGITLIELFAWMTEMILYRVNQIPDRHYVKFLELMGIRLFPPTAARAEIAFWLSAPQPAPLTVRAKTQVATVRTEHEESVVFMTDDDLLIVVPELTHCLTSTAGAGYEDRTAQLRVPGEQVVCFPSAAVGDAVYFGFEESLASNIVRLDLTVVRNAARGVSPRRPPWVWEVWAGDRWLPAKVTRDTTGGLNIDGSIELFIPSTHDPLAVGSSWAHWIRCRLVPPEPSQPSLEASPRIQSLQVVGLGGIATAHHGQLMAREVLGRSDGRPGQSFGLRRAPVLPRRGEETVVVATGQGEEAWTEVPDFAASGPKNRHFVWDGSTGEISFGPLIQYPDGTSRLHGAIPPHDAEIVVTGYRCGGGSRGNVGSGTLSVLKTSIPFIARVDNSEPATGGVDAETVDNAKIRGPMTLRSGQRAVTEEDFERLTLEASPMVARARCVAPAQLGGSVKVLIIPRVDIPPERLVLNDLALPDALVDQVATYLDERRILTTVVELAPPYYQGVTVVAQVRAAPGARTELLESRLASMLYRYLNPLTGGPAGTGWPFGRELNVGEIFALLAGAEGVVGVEEVQLHPADLLTGQQLPDRQRISLSPDAVLASFRHQVGAR